MMEDEYRWLSRANEICKKFGFLQGSGLAGEIISAMQAAFELGVQGKKAPPSVPIENQIAKRRAGENIERKFAWYCLCGSELQGIFINTRDAAIQGEAYWQSHVGLGHGPTDKDTALSNRKKHFSF